MCDDFFDSGYSSGKFQRGKYHHIRLDLRNIRLGSVHLVTDIW